MLSPGLLREHVVLLSPVVLQLSVTANTFGAGAGSSCACVRVRCVVNASLILLCVQLSFTYNGAPLSSHTDMPLVCCLRSTSAGVSCVITVVCSRKEPVIQCAGNVELNVELSCKISVCVCVWGGPFIFQAVVLESRCDKYLPPVAK